MEFFPFFHFLRVVAELFVIELRLNPAIWLASQKHTPAAIIRRGAEERVDVSAKSPWLTA
jgi:hypothetical protein